MPSPLASLTRRVRTFIDDVVLYRHTSPEQESLIGEEARAQTFRITRPLVLAACFMGLLWWPFDLVLYSSEPQVITVFARWRAAVVVYCLVYHFTCERFVILRRHSEMWGAFLGATITLCIAASLGSLGSLERPWFASLYFAPIMTFPFLVRPFVRLVATAIVAVAGLVGFFGVHPANLLHAGAGTAIGLMLFGVAVATCAGHATYHLFRLGFLKSLELAERTRQLEDLSRTLVDRVEARTAELRLLAVHIEELRESERSAVARELHDELGQLLTGMRMELDIAVRVNARGGDLGPQHKKLGELLDVTLDSTRSLLTHLRPRVLDDLGLVAALDWLASDTHRRSGLEISFQPASQEASGSLTSPASLGSDDLAAPGEVATGVFRIVQESLTNVVRHARARHVRVSLMRIAGGIVATVADDGVGLPPVDERRPGSMGLLFMRERASALGGTFEIASPDHGGTLVTVRLPLPPLRAVVSDSEVA